MEPFVKRCQDAPIMAQTTVQAHALHALNVLRSADLEFWKADWKAQRLQVTCNTKFMKVYLIRLREVSNQNCANRSFRRVTSYHLHLFFFVAGFPQHFWPPNNLTVGCWMSPIICSILWGPIWMRGLADWNLGDLQTTPRCVRRCDPQIVANI